MLVNVANSPRVGGAAAARGAASANSRAVRDNLVSLTVIPSSVHLL